MFIGVDYMELVMCCECTCLEELVDYLEANSMDDMVVSLCRRYMVSWMNRAVAMQQLSCIHEHQALLSIQRIQDNHTFMQYFIRLLDLMVVA